MASSAIKPADFWVFDGVFHKLDSSPKRPEPLLGGANSPVRQQRHQSTAALDLVKSFVSLMGVSSVPECPGSRLRSLLAAALLDKLGVALVRHATLRVTVGMLGAGGLVVHLRCWRSAGWRIVPQAAVLQDLLDQVRLVGLDEADDLNRPAALGAAQGSA
jgi:hypothetical protein